MKLLSLKIKKAKGFYLQNGAHNGATEFCSICIVPGNLASLAMHPRAPCLMSESRAVGSSSFYVSLRLLSRTLFVALFQFIRARRGEKVHLAQFGTMKKLPSNIPFCVACGFCFWFFF